MTNKPQSILNGRPIPAWRTARISAAVIAMFCLVMFAGGRLTAQTTQVTSASLASLQTALSIGGTVLLQFDGTITTTNPLEISFDTVLDASSNSVTLSGGNSSQIFSVDPGVTFTIKNVVLSGGSSAGSTGGNGSTGSSSANFGGAGGNGSLGGDGLGGAIFNEGTNVLIDCIFTQDNAAGGVGGSGGNGGNGASHSGNGGSGGSGGNGLGGAIYNLGTILVTNCTFAGNTAFGGDGGSGGTNGTGPFGLSGSGGVGAPGDGAAVYNLGAAVFVGCTFNQNTSQGGNTQPNGPSQGTGLAGGAALGAGLFNAGTNTLINCTFYLNDATGGAGGTGGASINGISSGGAGGNGGGAFGGNLYNSGPGSTFVTNCTFSSGKVTGGAAGAGGSGPPQGNSGSPGSASGANIANGGGVFNLKNSILALPTNGPSASGTITDKGNNISSDGTPAFSTTNSFNNRDPQVVVPVSVHGGPTLTISLKNTSPAIDAIYDSSAPATDQRGLARPVGPRSDIGAYEFGPFTNNFTITGQITVGTNAFAGVTVTAGGASSVTRSDGSFSFLLSAGGTYLISPQPLGYFSPMTSNVLLSTNVSNLTFNGTVNFDAGVATIVRSLTNTNALQISFPAVASTTYRLQAATNLVSTNVPSTNWVDIATNTAGGGVLFYTVTPSTNFPRRFFRTVTP